MNESPDHIPDENADQLLDDLLSSLKSLAPPLETRIASRTAVARELSRSAAEAEIRSLPWWRRSISVPLPIAASLAALMLASLMVPSRWPDDPHQSADQHIQPTHASDEDPLHPTAPSTFVSSIPTSPRAMEYYETEIYLCGVGRLSSESGYVIREQ